MRGWKQEADQLLGMFRVLPKILKAQRDIGRARRFRREGRGLDAFRVAAGAFGVLHQQAMLDNPGASAIIVTDAVFLDELAREVGHLARPERK